MKFKSLPPGSGPMFVESVIPGRAIGANKLVQVGDTVTLKAEEITVLARVTVATDLIFLGEVLGFEETLATEVEGTKIGDTVEFSLSHITGCIKA